MNNGLMKVWLTEEDESKAVIYSGDEHTTWSAAEDFVEKIVQMPESNHRIGGEPYYVTVKEDGLGKITKFEVFAEATISVNAYAIE